MDDDILLHTEATLPPHLRARRIPSHCYHLYDSIQSAVAKLVVTVDTSNTATYRMRVLLDLIPQEPVFPLSM